MKEYPCDFEDNCPYGAVGDMDCYHHCGLGADEDSYPDEDASASSWD